MHAPHRFFNDPLTRQVNEGIIINMSLATDDRVMNSKSEFRQGVVPTIQTVLDLQNEGSRNCHVSLTSVTDEQTSHIHKQTYFSYQELTELH